MRAIGALPLTVAVAAPTAICLAWGADPGWGLPGAAAALPVVAATALIWFGLRLMRETISLFSELGLGTLAPWDPTRRLVVRGPYRRVRNPMISGVFSVLLGEAALLGSPAILVWSGGFALVNSIYMPLVEEPGLARRFGEDYMEYKRNVPRWIPRRRPWTPTFALALALVAGLAIPAASSAGAVSGVAAHNAEQGPAAVRDYWTPERMEQAEPIEAPGQGSLPSGFAPTASASAQPPDQEIPAARDLLYPDRIHGRLFFTLGPDIGSCSATVVTSRSRNVILTAGHCVVSPSETGPVWHANLAFVPGYRDGATPFGIYIATFARAPVFWSFEGDISFDLAAVNLAPAAGGQIENLLGSRGVSFNRTAGSYKKNKTRFSIFGYPAQPSGFYDGERPILCDSPFRGFEKFTVAVTSGPCNQKEGSSGGGWVLKGGLLNSVVSHGGCGLSIDCTLTSGTYFGTLAFKTWSAAGGGIAKGRKKRLAACKKKRGGKRFACISRAQTFQGFQP